MCVAILSASRSRDLGESALLDHRKRRLDLRHFGFQREETLLITRLPWASCVGLQCKVYCVWPDGNGLSIEEGEMALADPLG